MNDKERVWCAPRSELPNEWLQIWTSIALNEAELKRGLQFETLRRLSRSDAETDPTYKQLIPYTLIRQSSSRRFACYQRRGSETRLHRLWSIGVGGHLNESDAEGCREVMALLHRGLCRELQEELAISSPKPRLLGLINEEKTGVGKVHLGIVFLVDMDASWDVCPGKELYRFGWKAPDELSGLNLEYWSQLAWRLIPEASNPI